MVTSRVSSVVPADSFLGPSMPAVPIPPLLVPPVPPQPQAFDTLPVIAALFEAICTKKSFSVSFMRRFSLRFMSTFASTQLDDTLIIHRSSAPLKPSALDVEAMAQGGTFDPGPLDFVAESPLHPDAWLAFHIDTCFTCSDPTNPNACYFEKLDRCLRHGWNPRLTGPIIPRRPYTGNYPPAQQHFWPAVDSDIAKLLHSGAIVALDSSSSGTCYTPLNCVLKNSDRQRALAVTGLNIRDADTLATINAILASAGQAPVKVRTVFDVTATGVNAVMETPPHSLPSIDDHLSIVTPGCFLVKKDVSRYYNCFPLAPSWRDRLAFIWRDVLYGALAVLFGMAEAAHFCATLAAELRRWFLHRGFRTSHIMDDHLFAAESMPEALSISAQVDDIFAAVGLPNNADKDELGQQIVFAGFLIDTVRMSLSFHRDHCLGLAVQIRETLTLLPSGGAPELGSLRSIRGKCNHLAQVLQLGRLFMRGLNKVVFNYPGSLERFRPTIIHDLEFWFSQLGHWSRDSLSGKEFPILNSSIFERHSKKVLCLITDASGLDGHGCGGVECYLFEDDFGPVFAVSWKIYCMQALHSHGLELQALLFWLLHTDKSSVIVFWFSDSSSAVWSLNKGYCANSESFDILYQILSLCDKLQIWLVGFWLPREWNQLADYLTHLTALLDRDFISCSVADLATPAYLPTPQEEARQGAQGLHEVPAFLQEALDARHHRDVAATPALLVRSRDQESGLRQVPQSADIIASDTLVRPPASMARPNRLPPAQARDTRASVSRHDPVQPEGPAHAAPVDSHIVESIDGPRGPNFRRGSLAGTRWPSPSRRDTASPPRQRHRLGSPSSQLRALSPAYQDTSVGPSSNGRVHTAPRPVRRQVSSSPLRSPESLGHSRRLDFSDHESPL